jgi:hypothetical protein
MVVISAKRISVPVTMDSGDAVTAELYQNMNVYLMLTVLSGNVILMQIV